MKIKSLIAKSLLVCLCFTSINCVAVFANDNNIATASAGDSRAVVTGYKYTTINGVCYRRLWNYTTGQWVDSQWSKCPAATHNH